MLSIWIVSVPALPLTESSDVKPVTELNLKISSPEPPISVSVLVLEPSSIIKNVPLETAEPSIEVVESPVVVVIVNEVLPKPSKVALPKVKLCALAPARAIFSIPTNSPSSGAVNVKAASSVKDNVSVPAPPSTVSTPPDTLNEASSATIIMSLPSPPLMWSTPAPPVILSTSAPPSITSLPAPPRSVSAPPLP